MDPLAPNCIRLLHIDAGTGPEIRCRLYPADIDSLPFYEALSYAWGACKKVRTIYCNGEELQIALNLYEALQQLRRDNHKRVMWIDAICINQEDKREQSEQVRIMEKIYAKANHVVVWLGKNNETDSLAFDILSQFQRAFDNNSRYEYNVSTNKQTETLPDAYSPYWTALVELFQRPWFLRVWVIQEVVMAKEVSLAFGPLSVSWELIVKVSRACQKGGYMGSYTIEGYAPGSHSVMVIDSLKTLEHRTTLIVALPSW